MAAEVIDLNVGPLTKGMKKCGFALNDYVRQMHEQAGPAQSRRIFSIVNADLRGCQIATLLHDLVFRNCDFSGSNFRANTSLIAEFIDCDFSNATFNRGWLDGSFKKCNFREARFYHTKMLGNYYGSDFSGAILSGAKMAAIEELNVTHAQGILSRKHIRSDCQQDMILGDSGETVHLTIGCQRFQPHHFWRLASNMAKKFGSYPEPIILTATIDMLQQAKAINDTDPTQWRGAAAQLQRIEETIWCRFPDQHPVPTLQRQQTVRQRRRMQRELKAA